MNAGTATGTLRKGGNMANRKKSIKKILPVIIGLGSAAAAAGAYYAVINHFFKLGFNARFQPVEDDDGFARGTNYSDVVLEGKKWLFEAPSERVELISHDGTKLVGHYFAAENAKRTVIGFHGWRAKWFYDYGSLGKWLHDNGSNLLLIEQRGQGTSEGEFMGFGITEHLDVPMWVNWVLDNKKDGLPIFLFGRSMGASTVLMASGKELPEEVAGIIADCGFSAPYDMLKYFCTHNAHLPEHPFMDGVVKLIKSRTGVDVKSYSAYEAVQHATKPILFIHGDADGFVPEYMTHDDYNACASEKKLLIVHGADHCMSDLIDPLSYWNAVNDFFSEYGG